MWEHGVLDGLLACLPEKLRRAFVLYTHSRPHDTNNPSRQRTQVEMHLCHLLVCASEAARFHLAYERAEEHAREALARLGGMDVRVPLEIKGNLKGKASYQLAALHFYQQPFDEAEALAREALARHEDALRGMPPEHTEECLISFARATGLSRRSTARTSTRPRRRSAGHGCDPCVCASSCSCPAPRARRRRTPSTSPRRCACRSRRPRRWRS